MLGLYHIIVKMKNKITLGFGLIFIVVLLLASISAAGIVSPYWKDNPLYMNYGETQVVNFKLQNMVGEGDITVTAIIVQGGEIATLSQDTFTAPTGTKNTLIPITITIPKDYDKSVQVVELEVKTVTEDTEGMISLGSGWTTSFNVILSEKPVEKSSLMSVIIGLVIVIILALIIIIFLIKRRK